MKAVTFFLGADLRSGHIGLQKLAKTKGTDLQTLQESEAVIFINTQRNKVKSYSSNGVLSYIRLEPGRTVDLHALEEFPMAFSPKGRLDYKRALKRALIKRLHTPGRFKELEIL